MVSPNLIKRVEDNPPLEINENTKKLFQVIYSEQAKKEEDDDDIHILLGEDLGPKLNGPYGFVYIKYHTPLNLSGEVGVLGPARLNYNSIVPTVRYFGDLIGEIAKGW